MGFHYRIFLLLLCVLTFINFNTAKPLFCYDTGNFTVNGLYGKNRDLALSSLASNTSENGGFYNTIVGEDPNKVYALALCSEGYSPVDCSSCINLRIQELNSQCPNQKEAIAWGGCVIHYANRFFFGILELSPNVKLISPFNLTVNPTEFDQIWESLMDGLVRNASTGASTLKYATGEAKLTSFQTIYAQMQCIPDLSQSDCDVCLRQSVSDYENCCHGKQGGTVVKPSCKFRWDLYPFYTPVPHPPSRSPPTTSAKLDNRRIARLTFIIVVVSTTGFMAILAITTCSLLRKRWKSKQEVNGVDGNEGVDDCISAESLRFDLGTLRVATDNFSSKNKLGQGGFGVVYKGKPQDGRDIAVKTQEAF